MKCLLVFLSVIVVYVAGQANFGGSTSRGNRRPSSNSNRGSSRGGGGGTDTDTKFFGITTGNEAIDGGIIGTGAGFLLGSALAGATNNPCGRRKRQINDPNKKFFGNLFGGNSGCNCGRRKRDAPAGEADINNRFFGLENLFGLGGGNNCGCNCGGGFNNG